MNLTSKTASLVLLLALAACGRPNDQGASAPEAAPAAVAAAPTPQAASAGLAKLDGMPGFSLDLINEAQDPLNKPAVVPANAPITFTGFGYDPNSRQPGKAVDLVLDGTAYPTTYGSLRQDVADYTKVASLANTGFTVTLPGIAAGTHKAVVRVVSSDGASFTDSLEISFTTQ